MWTGLEPVLPTSASMFQHQHQSINVSDTLTTNSSNKQTKHKNKTKQNTWLIQIRATTISFSLHNYCDQTIFVKFIFKFIYLTLDQQTAMSNTTESKKNKKKNNSNTGEITWVISSSVILYSRSIYTLHSLFLLCSICSACGQSLCKCPALTTKWKST